MSLHAQSRRRHLINLDLCYSRHAANRCDEAFKKICGLAQELMLACASKVHISLSLHGYGY